MEIREGRKVGAEVDHIVIDLNAGTVLNLGAGCYFLKLDGPVGHQMATLYRQVEWEKVGFDHPYTSDLLMQWKAPAKNRLDALARAFRWLSAHLGDVAVGA